MQNIWQGNKIPQRSPVKNSQTIKFKYFKSFWSLKFTIEYHIVSPISDVKVTNFSHGKLLKTENFKYMVNLLDDLFQWISN